MTVTAWIIIAFAAGYGLACFHNQPRKPTTERVSVSLRDSLFRADDDVKKLEDAAFRFGELCHTRPPHDIERKNARANMLTLRRTLQRLLLDAHSATHV